MVTSSAWYLISLVGIFSLFWQNGYAQQVNNYSVFKVEKLGLGKNVTVGKYVLAYMNLNERIRVKGANPPQRLDIKLQWKQSAESKKPIMISGRWMESDRKLYIGMVQRQPVSEPKKTDQLPKKPKFLSKNQKDFPDPLKPKPLVEASLFVVKAPNDESISVPLNADSYIHILPDESLLKYGEKIRIVVSSNHAYDIGR